MVWLVWCWWLVGADGWLAGPCLAAAGVEGWVGDYAAVAVG